MGSLLIAKEVQPRYAQLYFFDTQNEITNRISIFMDKETSETVDENIVTRLIQMLDRSSAISQSFRMVREWCHLHGSQDFSLRLLTFTSMENTVTEIKLLDDLAKNKYLEIVSLEESFKCRMPDEINDVISAELPSLAKDLDEPFLAETVIDEDEYHIYRCRDNKVTAIKGPDRATFVIQENVTAGTDGASVQISQLEESFKCRMPDEINDVISAELPSLAKDLDETVIDEDEYHIYRCRDNKVTAIKGPDRATFVIQENVTAGTDGASVQISQLEESFKCRMPDEINDVISAELPSLAKDLDETVIDEDEYHIYRCRDNKVTAIKGPDRATFVIQENVTAGTDGASVQISQRYAFEALDKTLRDILGYKSLENRNSIFGGMTVLLGGDFWQILPVIPKAKRPKVVQSCTNRSELWKCCKVFALTRSMRVNEYTRNGEMDTRKQNFNRWVLAAGDGKLPAKKKETEDEPTWIEILEELLIKS
nr:hypothetical protein [Tanacetum cinerariifolium]